jgi:multiple sugar transport system substrate-binding protein
VGWFDYFNSVNPAVKDIAIGADPKERLRQASQQIDGLLAKYR